MIGKGRRLGVAAVWGTMLLAVSGCVAPPRQFTAEHLGPPTNAHGLAAAGCTSCQQSHASAPGSNGPMGETQAVSGLPIEARQDLIVQAPPGAGMETLGVMQPRTMVSYQPAPASPRILPNEMQHILAQNGKPEQAPQPKMDGPSAGPMMNAHPGVPGVPGNPLPPPGPCPREITMTSLPPYTIAPPDIITIDAVRLIPKPPYRIEPLEVLVINVTDTLPNQPIAGLFVVSPEGTVNLGFSYGAVRVTGLTLDQIQQSIRAHLANILRNPQVTVSLAQFRGLQQIRGEHLVRPDGTISMGTYGAVYVAGMTLGQVKCVIEKHLSEYLLNPQVSVDVFAYNSKVYYVILDGGGFGQQVIRLPVTGNETVLDAISQLQGLAPVSSKRRIWLARPAPAHLGCNQVLPVDWQAIVMGGSTATNYQIFPGDRVYVAADRLIAFDNMLSKILAPVERVLGVTLLGSSAVNSITNSGLNTLGFVVP
ncbi:MAG: polysaccharide biosynthesis/export family protein [Gemmataceae bacterium]|nr:polysaccharide biosynthesis/export family protein [Gemmataceae bacterium]